MSPTLSNPGLYEHTFVVDTSEDPLMQYYWPEAGSNIDRAWYQLDPSLDPAHSHQTYSMDRPSAAYDPIAHGFAEPSFKPDPPLPFQHNMNPGWPFAAYRPNHPHRQRSPISGISLSSIDSGSPVHAMSPDIATAMLPALVNDYNNMYPSPTSEPGAHHGPFRANTPHAMGASSYPSPTMMSPVQAYNMKEFMLHSQEDDIVDSSELLEVTEPHAHQLDLGQAEITEPALSQPVHESYIDEDPAAENDTDLVGDEIAVDRGDDSDYQPGRVRAPAARPRAKTQRPARTSNTGIQDPRSRIRKPATGPHQNGHARTPSSTSAKSKSKAKRPISPLNASSHSAPKPKQSFPCPFHHFGCPATFPNKNEWKRHTLSQHLGLGFYRCDLGACAMEHPSNITARRGFNDFNRKDLFTQHCRRMHKPDGWGRKEYNEVSTKERAAFDLTMEGVRKRCWKQKREAPTMMGCGFCSKTFSLQSVAGKDVWEARMEHVAKHYEREGREQVDEGLDPALLDWAVAQDVVAAGPNGQWRLISLLGEESEGLIVEADELTRRKGKNVVRSGVPPVHNVREGSRRSARFEARDATASYTDLEDQGMVEVDMGRDQDEDDGGEDDDDDEHVTVPAVDVDDEGAETDTDAPGEDE